MRGRALSAPSFSHSGGARVGSIRYIVYLFPVLTAAALFCFFLWYAGTQRAPLARRLDPERAKQRLSFAGTCHPMVKKDALPLLLITLVYACAAFFQAGFAPIADGIYQFA